MYVLMQQPEDVSSYCFTHIFFFLVAIKSSNDLKYSFFDQLELMNLILLLCFPFTTVQILPPKQASLQRSCPRYFGSIFLYNIRSW